MVVATRHAGELLPAYEAVVIGTGYGGSVAASRLARMGLRTAVLEQGRHWRAGDFPTTLRGRRRQMRLTGRAPRIGDPAGLYYLSVGKGLTVFGASGVGGGSLINAGVALRPDTTLLRRAGWPQAVLSDGLLAEGLARGEAMLGVAQVPAPERFGKYAAMRLLATAAGRPAGLSRMTIAHSPGPTVTGILQYACRCCGDCWSGCNLGAKGTTAVSYIADAVDHGASLFAQSRAHSIARREDGWEVVVEDLEDRGTRHAIRAPVVVLAAGTMGTNEILFRARRDGLALSDRLGERFSANGDDLVFAGDMPDPVHGVAIGYPSQAPRGAPAVGPHSMALIDLGDDDGPLWLHDGTMLTAMATLAPLKELLRFNLPRAFALLRSGIFGEALRHTQVLYIVSHDDAGGKLRFENDRLWVDWPGYSTSPLRLRAERKVKAVIEAAGATFHSNPFAMTAFGGNRVIAHPLGGAGMADTVDTGVTSPDGLVFDPTKGPTGVHDGLYVLDGAAIPSSVGVSPLLTITGLAERAMMLAARRIGRPLDVEASLGRPLRDAAM
ncbi:MAG: GMC family oxidoreductase N-terminal domain-containing protein [Hyphomicrobiaceae bacterium]